MRRALALLTLVGGTARADDAPTPPPAPSVAPAARPVPPPTSEQAAEAVLAAVTAKDDAALQALAAKDDPDPWLVADELIRRGEVDAADAFAKAAPRVDVESLPAYVANRRGKADDAGRRARLVAVNAALRATKFADAIDALGTDEHGPIDDVVGVRLAMGKGSALRALVRLEAAAAAFFSAGEAAERLGWLSRASQAFDASGGAANQGSAFAAAKRACERRRSVCDRRGDGRGAAAALGNIGAAELSLGDYAGALATSERALAAQDALEDRAGAARTLGNIGIAHFRLGEYAQALSTYERAQTEMEALGDAAGAARTLVNIGVVYDSLGDYRKALAVHERALAAQVALGDAVGAATTLQEIGNVNWRVGDHARALSADERALAAQEALGDRVGAATTLSNIGVVHTSLGSYAKALDVQERALAALEALGDRAGVARVLGNIANVYASLGDHEKSLAAHQRSLAAKETLGDRAGAAVTLGNIGAVYVRLGDYAKALPALERAMAAKSALGDRSEAARTLGGIGTVYHLLGDYARALATLKRALAAQEALGDTAGAAMTLRAIGWALARLGDPPEAIRHLEHAVRASEEIGANGSLALALGSLAEVRLQSGDAGHALAEAHRAVSLLTTLVGGLGEEQGATAREQYTALFATGLAAAAKAGDVSEAAFFLESGRAGTMLESLGSRERLRAVLLPEELRVADVQARAGEARALIVYAKARAGGDLAAIRARNEELKAARAGVIDVFERIQREAKRAVQVVYPMAAKVEEIRGFLAPREALVLYGLAEKDEIAHALVVTKDEARIVALGRSSEIVTACAALDPTDRDADSAAALGRLRELIVKPLGLPKETKRLLVSPDGPLSYVPFAALVPDLVVAYESSGSTYGVLREEKDKRGEQVLALGDPDYAARFDPIGVNIYAPIAAARASATRGGRLAPLPGTREEAMAIADVALYGKDASESGLRAALAKKKDRWHSIHFACHGLVNPDRPTLSSLALTPQGEDDGFLTALEVLKMEIPSDLVVLSACETGKGKIVGGEGIVGLTRAFMYAGSPRVICSLWKVDDAATRALMTKFYELWNPKDGKPGLPTAEALKQAQEFVKSQEKWKHPYYWAAWVLWGLPS